MRMFGVRVAALLVGVLAAGTAGCAAEEKPVTAPCDAALDAVFGAWARAGFSGTVAVSTGGRFDCLAGYGTANDTTGAGNTAGTVFSIGSVSKVFTATAILRLAETGRLSLDDRVGTLVPAVTGPAAEATVRHLLLHTSGIDGSIGADDQPLDRAGAIAAINRLEPAFPPGTDDAYSNAGYTLLAIIIDTVSGMPFRDYLFQHVLTLPGGVAGGFWHGRPAAAGPVAAGYLDGGEPGRSNDFAGPYWTTEGNGSMAMTTRELATWTRALFTGDLAGPAGQPGHAVGQGRSHTLGGWVAFGAPVYGRPIVAAAGGGGDVGHNTAVVWIPGLDRVVALSSNRAELAAEELLAATLPALVTGGPLPAPTAPAHGGDPAALAGRYRLETGGSFEVTVADGRARIAASGADAVGVLFPPRGRFSAGDLREHEERVLSMLGGRTGEGRAEREAVQERFGPVTAVAGGGTVVADGEMRTYVTMTTRDGPRLGWYAVDEHSTIEGAELPTGPPALTLAPVGTGGYRPDDPAGTGPQVTLAFDGGRLTVSGPAGTATARR